MRMDVKNLTYQEVIGNIDLVVRSVCSCNWDNHNSYMLLLYELFRRKHELEKNHG